MNKDKKINEILNSLDGIQRAEVSPFLYSGIINKLKGHEKIAPVKVVWLAAASLCLLFLLNIAILKNISTEKHSSAEMSAVYNLSNQNMINYN
jgi:hypothetical protein